MAILNQKYTFSATTCHQNDVLQCNYPHNLGFLIKMRGGIGLKK